MRGLHKSDVGCTCTCARAHLLRTMVPPRPLVHRRSRPSYWLSFLRIIQSRFKCCGRNVYYAVHKKLICPTNMFSWQRKYDSPPISSNIISSFFRRSDGNIASITEIHITQKFLHPHLVACLTWCLQIISVTVRGGSSGSFGGPSLGGWGLTYPIFKFLHGFRPLYFEIAEF